jgi:hypothetical protein
MTTEGQIKSVEHKFANHQQNTIDNLKSYISSGKDETKTLKIGI